jgi:hypothetical protein
VSVLAVLLSMKGLVDCLWCLLAVKPAGSEVKDVFWDCVPCSATWYTVPEDIFNLYRLESIPEDECSSNVTRLRLFGNSAEGILRPKMSGRK